jgi:hypothetical protein
MSDFWCDRCVEYVPDGAGVYVGDNRVCATCASGDSPVTGRSWIVAAMYDHDDDDGVESLDHWQVFETYDDAVRAYDIVIEEGASVASIAAVVRSTDYECVPFPAEIGGDQ